MSEMQKKDEIFVNLVKKLVGLPTQNSSCGCTAIPAIQQPFETTNDAQEAADDCCGAETPETGNCCSPESLSDAGSCCGSGHYAGGGCCG